MDERRKEVLIKALSSPQPEVRQSAAEALENMEIRERLDELARVLTDENSTLQERLNSLYTLSRLRGEKVLRVICSALSDRSEDVRATALRVLGEIGDRRVLTDIVNMLKDESPVVRRVALDALGAFREPKLIAPLMYALKSKDQGVVERAIELIARIGDSKAEKAMLYFALKGSPTLKALALKALGTMED